MALLYREKGPEEIDGPDSVTDRVRIDRARRWAARTARRYSASCGSTSSAGPIRPSSQRSHRQGQGHL
ncbi:MAG: hypothetical protein JRD89_07045 [Deltaproteobacteria bacterium]|nr:hypothetical protein [Deltaproteobacteria bacterium]